MKTMKKVLAMLLAVVMTLGMTVTTFAADDIVGNSDDTGTITVKGIEETDATITAYPIAMAEYDTTTGVFKGYANPYSLADIENPTKAELEAIDTTKLTGIKLVYDKTTNSYTKSDVAVGMYLIKVAQEEVTVYSDAVVSVKYSNGTGSGNVVENGQLTMTTKIADGVAWVKKTIEVEVDKTVEDKAGITSNIGDVNDYVVTIDPIPNYSGKYPVLKVTDVMSSGLTYGKDVKVYVDDAEISADKYEATFTEATNTLVVSFVVDGKYTMNEYAGKAAEIRYTAEVNENAKLNGGENGNTVTIDYTKDSTVDGDDGSDKDDTHVYTFDIDGQIEGNLTEKILTKVEESTSTTKTPLKDAEFALYTDEACTKPYTNKAGNWNTTSDGNGKFQMQGLAAGTYYFKETKAPGGYSLNTHVYKIVIDATIHEETGKLESWSITIDDATTSTFEMTTDGPVETKEGKVEIPNTKLVNLPSTGGIGTTIFTIVGCLIMIAAAVMFFVSRRKEAK